jgi:hypothetical protein
MMPSHAFMMSRSESLVTCLGALDLGDQERLAAAGAQQLAGHVHVGARFRKRYREIVDLQLGRGADVLDVLGRQRGRGQPATLPVDALVVGQLASVAHERVHFVAQNVRDVEHDSAIVEQQHRALAQVARQLLVVEPRAVSSPSGSPRRG